MLGKVTGNEKRRAASVGAVCGGGASTAGRIAVWSAVLLSGCGVTMEDVVNPEETLRPKRYFPHEEVNLSPARLEERMAEIDKSFAEPRTPAKVEYSYETSRLSISPENNFGALWRGARACAWLAVNHPERNERKKFADEGVAMGRAAVRRTSNRAEPFYYLSLCLLARLEIGEHPESGDVEEAEVNLKIAQVLDESLDHCGPDRALAELLVRTEDRPLLGVTSARTGLHGVQGAIEHLKAAIQKCGDYGENHLALARAHIALKEHDLARVELDEVMASSSPADRSAEHDRWLREASDLLGDLQGK
jgi:hypothetical protein